MRVRAPAKINLALQVVGKRRDGYHEIRTAFQSIALHDTLTFRRERGPFRLECDDPACPIDDRNLVWQAAARVWRAGGRRGAPRDVVVRIQKRIPMQGGLGGGSSDAAAALRACAKLWRVRLSAVRLRRMAAALGADVPFFLVGGTAIGRGRGDRVSAIADAPSAWVVVVIPSFGVSTNDAYGWWRASGRASRPASAAGNDSDARNDLQPGVVARHPEIGRIVSALRRAGASAAAMSGSGSAVFGLFGSRASATRAAKAAGIVRYRTVVTTTLNRVQYQRLAAI